MVEKKYIKHLNIPAIGSVGEMPSGFDDSLSYYQIILVLDRQIKDLYKRLEDISLKIIDPIDNLQSTSTKAALSANQGRLLNQNKLENNNLIAGENISITTSLDENGLEVKTINNIQTVPTKTSDLTNDGDGQSNFVTQNVLSDDIQDLQSQIDTISASSDVTDIVGSYADLQNYDTSRLGNNDIIKVLQDESRDDETTYYRWSTSTHTFTLIGEEGPYYTKSQTNALLLDKADKSTTYTKTETNTLLNDKADKSTTYTKTETNTLLNNKADKSTTYTKTETNDLLLTKQDQLTAGTNITISGNVISAESTVYTPGNNISIVNGVISAVDTKYSAGNGLYLTGNSFSADTTILATKSDLLTKQDKLTAGNNITISGNVISATGGGGVTLTDAEFNNLWENA